MGVEVKFDEGNQYIQIKGELICDTVMHALEQLTRKDKSLSGWVIDFTGVTKVDSTAVALLIELKKNVQKADKTISFIHLSETLLTIARLSQVDTLLSENKK
jgi:ABC-type transporter Mla MlaB component